MAAFIWLAATVGSVWEYNLHFQNSVGQLTTAYCHPPPFKGLFPYLHAEPWGGRGEATGILV